MKTAVHQYEDKLLEFAYGELPNPEAQAIEAHVRDCAKCTKALAEIRAVRSTMSALPMEAAPDAGLDSLLAYAEQAAARTRAEAPASRGWRRFLAPLASAMALVVVGVVAWRANETFDPDPAMMAVKAEREAKTESASPMRKGAPASEAPAPVAAAQPAEPAPAYGDEGGARNEKAKDVAEEKEAVFAEGKRELSKKPAPKPMSTAKRSKLAEEPVEQQVALADDYSNAAQRGATKAPGGGAFGFGLGSGSASTGPATESAAGRAGDKDQAEAPARQEPRAPAAAPAPPPAPAQTASAPAPKKSYSLPGLTKTRGSAPSSMPADTEADELALERSDALKADRDAKSGERQRAQGRASLLEAARVASSRGDRAEEARLVLEVLQRGASGYEKVEALKRACDAFEALGDFARADPYCDQLLGEFPQTAAAGAVAKRRSNVQRAAPAPRPADVSTPAAEPAQPGE